MKKKVKNIVIMLSKFCQKVVKKLSKKCQKVVNELSKSCQKVVKKLSKSCQRNVKVVKKLSKFKTSGEDDDDEEEDWWLQDQVATLSHLVKIDTSLSCIKIVHVSILEIVHIIVRVDV
jgi:HSP90 family molecular chaperone